MFYSEITEKLRNHERIVADKLTGYQFILLLQDGEIKNLCFDNSLYEVNFIPITYAFEDVYVINEETYDNFEKVVPMLKDWVNHYNLKKNIYIQLDDEYFEIVLELLET